MFHNLCRSYTHSLALWTSSILPISWASQWYKFPFWVMFDQNFHQAAADQGSTELAHLNPTLYANCFSGQTKEGNAWCQHCHSLKHIQIPVLLNPLLPSTTRLYMYLFGSKHRPGQHPTTRSAETSTKKLQIWEEVLPHSQLPGLQWTTPSNSWHQQARGPHPSHLIIPWAGGGGGGGGGGVGQGLYARGTIHRYSAQ